uniref:Major facilitator superfamily (MFS) profile domain-containing protein n=1 Tax=Timema monikensis TaxID=170555 RepID=A0A7R9DZM0_9NEOP|nr:unnamed protein product [Timema monikensis]
MTAGMHMLSLVTVAAVPEHRCRIPGLEGNDSFGDWNSSEISSYIPKTDDGFDSCHIWYNATNTSQSCTSWVYDRTYFQTSRAVEWDFVCSRRWMGAASQSVYMFGVFTGAVLLGTLADKYGRKTIFCISAVLQVILGVGVAFVSEYYSFLVTRFFYGMFGSAGSYITGFVLTMEIVGPSKRTACGVTTQASFALGCMLVAFWGFLIPNRQLLQIVYGLHGALLLGHWWLIDESPRWLWAQGRVHEAVTIVERAMLTNKHPVPLDVAQFVSKGLATSVKREDRSYGIGDIFKTPNMRCRAFNVCFNWFANSLVFYGLSLNTGKLYGNPFLVLFLACLVEIPSYIMTTLLMDRTGRRSLISTLMLLGGLACLISAYIPQETQVGSVSATSVVMLGKFFIAGSFAIIYNYTAELFPTVVRNTSLGVGSMCARLSGALTPLITLLDSFDKTLPSLIFSITAILSGLLVLLLPETLNKSMPQTLEEGERFGVGDNACTNCYGRRNSHPHQYNLPLSTVE